MSYAFFLFVCAACQAPAQANPLLVMSIPATWAGTEYVADPAGKRQPICEACARALLARFEREGLPIPAVVREPNYFSRAYHEGADEQDL